MINPRLYLQSNRKRFCLRALLALVCTIIATSLHAQTFTRITTGAPVTDGGASRAVVWVDYDHDNDLDLFVTNGLRAGQRAFLYRNDGAPNFTFTKITDSPLVGDAARADGSTWGDYDNDGDLDAYVVTWYGDRNLFYENGGAGVFTKITSSVIVGDNDYTEAGSWGDFDNDGWLDLYVTNSGTPNTVGPQRNYLYRNNRDKTFTKVTTGAQATEAFYSRGVNWVDYDDDGDFDLFVVNEENQANNLYRNLLKENGTASFEKITSHALVAERTSSWSASWGDYDNDGDLDAFVSNWGGPSHLLFRNDGGGAFTKITDGILVSEGGFAACTGWGDYDNDGDLDLFITNAYASVSVKNTLYRNVLMETGSPDFEKITEGDHVNDLGWSYGFSWGDYDRDGDLDIFVARTLNEAQNNAFYRNNGNANHWLEINAVGTTSNRSAIGAKIFVKAAINNTSVWLRRDLEGQSGYCGQNLQAHFGLGNASTIDSLKIVWPSGRIDIRTQLKADTVLTIVETPSTAVQEGAFESAPRAFELAQNFPNPFSVKGRGTQGNPATTIRYHLASAQPVKLIVYDTLGQTVATLVDEQKTAGTHIVRFAPPPSAGAGLYFYRLSAGQFEETRKLVLMK